METKVEKNQLYQQKPLHNKNPNILMHRQRQFGPSIGVNILRGFFR